MRKWLTAFILVAAMFGGMVGVGAHEAEGSMANIPDCCKKAQLASNAPQVALARLCCNMNCSEPGSSGSNASSSLSPQPGITPNGAGTPTAAAFTDLAHFSRYAQSPRRQDSSPKYIQHLALLI
jgi:hypothetical protein